MYTLPRKAKDVSCVLNMSLTSKEVPKLSGCNIWKKIELLFIVAAGK